MRWPAKRLRPESAASLSSMRDPAPAAFSPRACPPSPPALTDRACTPPCAPAGPCMRPPQQTTTSTPKHADAGGPASFHGAARRSYTSANDTDDSGGKGSFLATTITLFL